MKFQERLPVGLFRIVLSHRLHPVRPTKFYPNSLSAWLHLGQCSQVTNTPALTVHNGVQVPHSIHLLVEVDQDLVDVSFAAGDSTPRQYAKARNKFALPPLPS
jgi:hypothetical protein